MVISLVGLSADADKPLIATAGADVGESCLAVTFTGAENAGCAPGAGVAIAATGIAAGIDALTNAV